MGTRGPAGTPMYRANPGMISPTFQHLQALQRPALPPPAFRPAGLSGPIEATPMAGNNLPGPVNPVTPGMQTEHPSVVIQPIPSTHTGPPINVVEHTHNPGPLPHPPPAPSPGTPWRAGSLGTPGPKDWSPRSGRCACKKEGS